MKSPCKSVSIRQITQEENKQWIGKKYRNNIQKAVKTEMFNYAQIQEEKKNTMRYKGQKERISCRLPIELDA